MRINALLTSIIIPTIVSTVFGFICISIDNVTDIYLSCRILIDALVATVIGFSASLCINPSEHQTKRFSVIQKSTIAICLILTVFFYLMYRMEYTSIWKIVAVLVTMMILSVVISFICLPSDNVQSRSISS